MSAERHLKPVTAEQQLAGEVQWPTDLRECWAKLNEAADVIAAHESTIRGKDIAIANLRRDKEREARGSSNWPAALRLFKIWRKLTGSTARWNHRRFELVEPFLKDYDPEKHDIGLSIALGGPQNPLEECAAAICGRVFDHFTKPRTNGTTKHFWEWERIFEGLPNTTGQFDESLGRRPRDWRQRVRDVDPDPPEVDPTPTDDDGQQRLDA